MKKQDKLCLIFLYIMVLALPVTEIVLSLLGYQLRVNHYPILACIATAVFSVLCILLLIADQQVLPSIPFSLLLPLSAVNLFFTMWESNDIFVTALAAVWVILSAAILFRRSKTTAKKIISAIFSALLVFFCALIAFLFFFFGQIGQNTVVNTIVSPDGTYRAEVIDCDQGALGGNTIVEVYDGTGPLKLLLFEIEEAPRRVYLGDWGEFKGMEVYWESEQTLIIDGNSYNIS